MPGFTEVENRILKKYISDPKLSNSLALIRGVMESIWANDAPRIVQNYTDHGIEHSERIVDFVEKLLQVNPDADFSEQEIYLLLAGVYLHDIGMQCDVVKYPAIKERAEAKNLGAKFDKEFTAETTNGYSPDEQNEIRKNHHLLSAAWIDYLYEGNDPKLSPAIKSVPYDLVDDLMDLCKFHSKLPINDCSNFFNDNPNSRKKMVAALLRFADELDISNTRVNIGTAKIFSIYPDNSVYWWLHNYTKVNFVGPKKVRIKVNLHPEDFESYGSFVREEYITHFKNKNQLVLDVLVGQNIPIVIDNDSDVVAHNRAEKFPPEITAVLDKKIQESDLSPNSKIPAIKKDSGSERPKGKEPKSNVPYSRNPYFTGRDKKLEQIHETLLLNKTVALSQPVAVCGLGGVGKTQTAVEYTYRYRDEYEFVLWVKADSEDTIISDYVAVAKLLDLPVKNDSDQNLVVSAVLNWFKNNENWLLVFDNADEPLVLKNFMPLNPKGHILLTSRAHLFDELDITNQLEMDKMLPDEARKFFIKRTGRENLKSSELKALDELTSELDYLPLAIEQAGAYIKKVECSFEDYLSSYKKSGLKLLEKSQIVTDKYPKSVATTWLLNFEMVEKTSKASAEILSVSAFLNPSQIPVDIFIKGAKELGPVISSALEDVESLPVVLFDVLEPLRQYSLITHDTDNHTYDIHRLVQAVLRDRMDENTQQLWVERAVKAVNLAFPEVEYKNWEFCDKLLPHAQTCAEYIELWDIETEESAKLLNETGKYLYERVRFEECELFYNRALNIRNKILDPDHPDLAESLNDLAELYWSQGKYSDAEPLFKRALEIREKVLGSEHPDVASSLNNLALLYKSQGKYSDAEPLYTRALKIREKVLGSEHPDVASSLNNLAALYVHQGKYSNAEPLYTRALEIREKVLGSEHPDVATSLNNLAELYVHQGKYSNAEPLYTRALEINEKVLGSEHPDVATSLNNLAELYVHQGKYSDAEPLLKRALEIREKVLGSEHPDVASSLNNLAALYRSQGKYSNAEPLFKRALEIQEKVLGSEHPDMAIPLNNLAALYVSWGKNLKAKELFVRSINITEKSKGEDHPDFLKLLTNYAQLLIKMRKGREASKILKRVEYIRAKNKKKS